MNFIAVFSLSRPDFSKRNRYDMLYNFNIVYQLMKKVIIRLQIPMDAKPKPTSIMQNINKFQDSLIIIQNISHFSSWL